MSDTTAVRPDSNGPNGRAPDGRWAPGNRGGPGNPHARRSYELRRALLDAARLEDVQAVGAKLAELARAGDVPAIKLFLEYTVGKPVQAVALTDADGEPLGVDWSGVEAAVLAALAPFGEPARFAVALALRGVVNDAGRAEPTGDEA